MHYLENNMENISPDLDFSHEIKWRFVPNQISQLIDDLLNQNFVRGIDYLVEVTHNYSKGFHRIVVFNCNSDILLTYITFKYAINVCYD